MRNVCVSINIISFNDIKNYNSFSPFLGHVECFKCNNFGPKYQDYKSRKLRPLNQRREEYFVINGQMYPYIVIEFQKKFKNYTRLMVGFVKNLTNRLLTNLMYYKALKFI